MKNQLDNTVRKTNRSAIKSLVAGLLSLLIYALVLSLPPIYQSIEAWIIIGLIAGVNGVILCVISLNFSSEALKQFKRDDNVEKGYGIAITGRILGVLGVIASIFFCILIFLGLSGQ